MPLAGGSACRPMSAVWNCPSCEAANPPRVTVCEECGYERPAPPKSLPISTTEALVRSYVPLTEGERQKVQHEVRELVASLGVSVSMPMPIEFQVAETTTPTCAGCAAPAVPAILRDARLWHTECWDRLRDRMARRKWAR